MKRLKDIIQEGILSDIDSTIDDMDNTTIITGILHDCNTQEDKELITNAWHKLHDICSKYPRIKSKTKLVPGKIYIKFPFNMDDNFGNFITICKHYFDPDTKTHLDQMFWKSTLKRPFKFDVGLDKWTSSKGWDMRDNEVYELPKEFEGLYTTLFKKFNVDKTVNINWSKYE